MINGKYYVEAAGSSSGSRCGSQILTSRRSLGRNCKVGPTAGLSTDCGLHAATQWPVAGQPAWLRDLHPRFFGGRGAVVSWHLASRAETVGLLHDDVNQFVGIVERKHWILLSSEWMAVTVGGLKAQSWIQNLETTQVAREQKILEETFDLREASPDVGLKVGVGAVLRVVLLVTATGKDETWPNNEEDDLSPVQHAQ